jgi:hypothetical protein
MPSHYVAQAPEVRKTQPLTVTHVAGGYKDVGARQTTPGVMCSDKGGTSSMDICNWIGNRTTRALRYVATSPWEFAVPPTTCIPSQVTRSRDLV